jgi:hypothetical protein
MVVQLAFLGRPLLNWRKQSCAHCGRTDMGGQEAARAVLGGGRAVCRPRVPGRMNCLGLVTRYGHQTPCRLCRAMFPVAGPPDPGVWRHWY